MSPARGDYRLQVSYAQAHLRLKIDRGRPVMHSCVTCGTTAREWAYVGGDPNELVENGKQYSLDQERYAPMCYPCHRRLDRARADGRSVDVCPRGHSWAENTGVRRSRGPSTGLRFCKACHRENDRTRRAQVRQSA
jgi:hypothetical protein